VRVVAPGARLIEVVSQRGLAKLPSVLGVATVGGLLLGFSVPDITAQTSAFRQQSTVSSAAENTHRWKTYTNKRFGFHFDYPPTSRVAEDGPTASQSGTQPDNLATIAAYSSSGQYQIRIQVFRPGIVKDDYGWPERPCGEWTFGPDDRPLSTARIRFAGQKTLHVVSRGFWRNVVTSNYYCINYRRNPVVMIFDEPPSSETQRILSSFAFLKTR